MGMGPERVQEMVDQLLFECCPQTGELIKVAGQSVKEEGVPVGESAMFTQEEIKRLFEREEDEPWTERF